MGPSWGQSGSANSLLEESIRLAGDSGILFVAASSNGNVLGQGLDNDKTPFYPASLSADNILSVAASDDSDRPASFSNFGKQSVDLFAPGVGIRSTLPNGRYGEAIGTSMAAPFVSGTAALIWSQIPNALVADVRNEILSNADPLPQMNPLVSSGARLNTNNAVLSTRFSPQAFVVVAPDVSSLVKAGIPDADLPIEPFRPMFRPPMARLTLFDDGSVEGELIRIRSTPTVIGRRGCDVNVPHDEMVSDRHLSIDLETKDAVPRWVISDLDSATGLWARVRRIELKEGSEFLIGHQRFQFQESAPLAEGARIAMLARIENGSYSGASSPPGNSYAMISRVPFLPLRLASGIQPVSMNSPGYSLPLIDGEYWIGRGTGTAMTIPEDPFLASKHVCISKELGEKWIAKTMGAPNGMWVRLKQIIVNNSCTFQIGEQRCRFVCSWTRDEF